MSYIVAWSDIEKPKKQKKNALFVLPPIQHDRYQIYRRKSDATRRFNELIKTDCIAIVMGQVSQITIIK